MTMPTFVNSIVPAEVGGYGDWRPLREDGLTEVMDIVDIVTEKDPESPGVEDVAPPRPPSAPGKIAWGFGDQRGSVQSSAVPGSVVAAPTEESIVPVATPHNGALRHSRNSRGSSSPDDLVPGGMFDFTDSEAIKRQVRNAVLKPHAYNVFDFYKTTGIWQYVAKHPLFENVTLAVIAINSVWIAIDTDWNKHTSLSDADPIFQVAENLFCCYFSFEWIVRFMAFKWKRDGLKDSWFVFDSSLCFLMVVETWIFPLIGLIVGTGGESPLGGKSDMLRLFRLLRLSRLLRMLKSLPELMILIKGMATAMKSVLYVLGLLILIIYVFAIMLTQLSDGTEMGVEYFDTVPLAMYSLLIYGTFVDDLAQFCNSIRAESYLVLTLVLVFVCLACLTVLNMLVGVLCEVVSAVAKTEKEMITTATVSEKMQGILDSLDLNSNGKISFLEFRKILDIPEALSALIEVGVDPAGVVDFSELMFFEDGDHEKPKDLAFETFMELILDLRESNVATVKDIKYLCRQLNPKLTSMTKDIEDLRNRAERMEDTLGTILKEVQKISSKLSER